MSYATIAADIESTSRLSSPPREPDVLLLQGELEQAMDKRNPKEGGQGWDDQQQQDVGPLAKQFDTIKRFQNDLDHLDEEKKKIIR